MTLLQITSLLVVLAGLFGAVNYLFLRLPSTIGIMIVALLASVAMMGLEAAIPSLGIATEMRGLVDDIHFSNALLEGMLGFLLFAGALHVKVSDLRAEWLPIVVMATIGVAISTIVVGSAFSWVTGMPLLAALAFGALISPTDPVAVLGVLKNAGLPKSLETQIAGESLFNDGVGYVAFVILVGLAFPSPGAQTADLLGAAALFLTEVVGGAALGLVLGFLTYQLMRRIDSPSLDVLLTLGLAFGGYTLAVALDVSAPIMAVCAGLLIGHEEGRNMMSARTREQVDDFWRLIDEILNAILFLLIGFEVFEVVFDGQLAIASAVAIAVSILARFAAVAIPILLLRPIHKIEKGSIPIMTWGGLKGGICVALALSLPESEWKPLILTATYVVVVFTIVVQGLTVDRLAARYAKEPDLI